MKTYSNGDEDVALSELLHVCDAPTVVREEGLDLESLIDDMNESRPVCYDHMATSTCRYIRLDGLLLFL